MKLGRLGVPLVVVLGGFLAAPHDAALGADLPGQAAMPVTADDVGAVLAKLGGDDRRTRDRLEALAKESETLHALIVARGRSYAKMARAGLLPVGGGLSGLVEHASRLERLRRALARDLERERAIAAERITLARERAALGDRTATLQMEQAALARSHTAILAAEDREAAFRRAFLGAGSPGPHTAVYGSGVGPLDDADLTQGFGALRGRMPFPIEGRVEVRQVRLPGADGPGLQMVAMQRASVRSVYPGRVAFADTYGEYGRAVIVDHGGGYYTVSASLSEIVARVGEDVRSGDTLGVVAPGSSGAVLYFELRRGAQVVNPAAWFGI